MEIHAVKFDSWQFMGALLTAWINNSSPRLVRLSTVCHHLMLVLIFPSPHFYWKRFPISTHRQLFFLGRIIIAKHHSRIVSEIGSFVRELLASAVKFEYNSIGDWKAGRIFADSCLGTVDGDTAACEHDGDGIAASTARCLLRFELWTQAASPSHHWHSTGCSPYPSSKTIFVLNNKSKLWYFASLFI